MYSPSSHPFCFHRDKSNSKGALGKSKHTGLAQQNDFGIAFLHMMMRLAKGHNKA